MKQAEYIPGAEIPFTNPTYERGDRVRVQGQAAWIIDPDGGVGPIIRMVGDDRDIEVYLEDISPIDDDEFCSNCGSVGCGHG